MRLQLGSGGVVILLVFASSGGSCDPGCLCAAVINMVVHLQPYLVHLTVARHQEALQHLLCKITGYTVIVLVVFFGPARHAS